jgi:Protein of unknown function (DUF3467)
LKGDNMPKKIDEKKMTLVRIIDNEKIDTYYSNCGLVHSTLYDFSFTFGRSFIELDKNKVTETFDKTIYLSPQQAKSFLSALANQVESYENTFGEISLGPKK